MSDSRIQHLSQLLESKNKILRIEAAQQLAQFPLSNETLRHTLRFVWALKEEDCVPTDTINKQRVPPITLQHFTF